MHWRYYSIVLSHRYSVFHCVTRDILLCLHSSGSQAQGTEGRCSTCPTIVVRSPVTADEVEASSSWLAEAHKGRRHVGSPHDGPGTRAS